MRRFIGISRWLISYRQVGWSLAICRGAFRNLRDLGAHAPAGRFAYIAAPSWPGGGGEDLDRRSIYTWYTGKDTDGEIDR